MYPHLAKIHVYHGLLQLGEVNSGGLHCIPIGHINEINLGHLLT